MEGCVAKLTCCEKEKVVEKVSDQNVKYLISRRMPERKFLEWQDWEWTDKLIVMADFKCLRDERNDNNRVFEHFWHCSLN